MRPFCRLLLQARNDRDESQTGESDCINERVRNSPAKKENRNSLLRPFHGKFIQFSLLEINRVTNELLKEKNLISRKKNLVIVQLPDNIGSREIAIKVMSRDSRVVKAKVSPN